MSNRPSPLISYAQNGEDIVLARALKPWERKGFWIDCGAGHPKYNSVTKLFSEFGWTGVNIEPLPDEFMLLTQDRPLDENIQCLLGAQNGVGTIFAGPAENRGSSTTDRLLAARYAKEFNQIFTETQVPIRTLTEILRAKQFPAIDFLKIDVEGAELEVLLGIDLSEFNPRILVIEATRPNSTEPNHELWEDRVLDSGYVRALFDGVNHFYVKATDIEFLNLLEAPANVLDDFKTIIQVELRQVAVDAQDTIDYHIELVHSTQRYVESLKTELDSCELKIAEHQQKVIDAEARNLILQTTNEALEQRVIRLHNSRRQPTKIRSFKIFRVLSLAKKILRKVSGRGRANTL